MGVGAVVITSLGGGTHPTSLEGLVQKRPNVDGTEKLLKGTEARQLDPHNLAGYALAGLVTNDTPAF